MTDLEKSLASLDEWKAKKQTHEARFSRVITGINAASMRMSRVVPIMVAYAPPEPGKQFADELHILGQLFDEMGECIIDYGLDMVDIMAMFRVHLLDDHPGS